MEGAAPVTFRVLVVDDEPSILILVKREIAKIDGLEFFGLGLPNDALKWADTHHFDIALVDYKMPQMNGLELITALKPKNKDAIFLLMTAYGDTDLAIEAIRTGVFDFIQKPFESDEFTMAMNRATEHLRLKNQNKFISGLVKRGHGKGELIGQSDAINSLRERIKLFAGSDAPVLITGETGVGKEIASRMIHTLSKRERERFTAVNCSAYAETLIESELFGHEKGAFTGADLQRVGKLEQAKGGTVLIDEVCEIPMHIQVKLLRVLQEKEFERVGGNKNIKLKARIISTTNVNVEEEIKQNRFRSDLYYRLNALRMHIPPLRERKDDIEPLAFHFLRKFSIIYDKKITSFSSGAMETIIDYSWPGNVRQLENTIDYATLQCNGNRITKEHLSIDSFADIVPIRLKQKAGFPKIASNGEDYRSSISNLEKQKIEVSRRIIMEALGNNKWRKSKTAIALGLTRSQLVYRLKKYGID